LWCGSWTEGLLWGGIIARIGIWHCTYPPDLSLKPNEKDS
jgi:hypothetical protein